MTFLLATLQLEPALQNCPALHIAFFRLQPSGNCVVPLEEGKTEGEPEHHLCHNLSNIIYIKPLQAAYRKARTEIVTGVISIEVSIVLC